MKYMLPLYTSIVFFSGFYVIVCRWWCCWNGVCVCNYRG